VKRLVRDRLAEDGPTFSFEFLPPKSPDEHRLLWQTIRELEPLRPSFVSVTYGAGGSTRANTIAITERIASDTTLLPVAHLTAVNHSTAELRSIAGNLAAAGVPNVLALRGDPPGGGQFKMTPGGFEFSNQLVEFIREFDHFSIGVAGFPEGHIACKAGKHIDWGYLKSKIEAGADYVLTQLFFDNADFYEFRDFLANKGIKIPLVPGIVPILNANQIKKFTAMCGARIPAALGSKLDEIGDDEAAATAFGIEYATKQCEDLLRNSAPGVHFYTLNKAHSTVAVLKNLKLA
jgi:methylenetetrahydrofolate reductase (NADPH)